MRMMYWGMVLASTLLSGCSADSIRVAVSAQRRADDVQQAVFDRQHDGLVTLLYQDTVQKLEQQQDEPLSAGQRAVLNDAWNERDLVEFWRVQHERSKALRLVGVDAKLFSDQSIVDLLYKSVAAKRNRAQNAISTADLDAGADSGEVGLDAIAP